MLDDLAIEPCARALRILLSRMGKRSKPFWQALIWQVLIGSFCARETVGREVYLEVIYPLTAGPLPPSASEMLGVTCL
jgi:hypothetical protein